MTDIDQIEQLSENVQSLINTKAELFKLQALGIVANTFSVVLKKMLLCLVFLFCLFFLSFGFATYLSQRMNNPFIGYLLVGVLYLFGFIIILLDRYGFLESIFLNKVLGFFFTSKTNSI